MSKFQMEKPEKIEKDPLFDQLLEAMKREDEIMKRIEEALKSNPNRKAAEKIVLKELAPLMDEAKKKTTEIMKEWFASFGNASVEKE